MKKLVCLVMLILVSCSEMPSKPGYEGVSVEFKGAWNNPAWDSYMVAAIKEHGKNLLSVKPTDWKDFANVWPSDEKGLINFWGKMFVEVAKWESKWKPETKYKESFGVWSRGLFQISVSSSNQSRYKCGSKSEEHMHDPEHNIRCFVKILNNWVGYDKRIAGRSTNKKWIEWRKAMGYTYFGGGRYFAVFRGHRDYTKKSLAAIKAVNK